MQTVKKVAVAPAMASHLTFDLIVARVHERNEQINRLLAQPDEKAKMRPP